MIILWPTCCQTTVARLILFVLVYFVMFDYYLGHSRKNCNTGSTRGESGASPVHLT